MVLVPSVVVVVVLAVEFEFVEVRKSSFCSQGCVLWAGHTRAPVFGVGRFFVALRDALEISEGLHEDHWPVRCVNFGCCVFYFCCCFVLKNVEEANNFKLPLEPLLPKLISRCAFIILDFYFLLVCLLALMGSIFN